MTVERMSEPERHRLRRDLVEFCEFADRLDHGVAAAEGDRILGSGTRVAAGATA